MRKKQSFWAKYDIGIFLGTLVVLFIFSVVLAVTWGVKDRIYIIKDPTEAQVVQLMRGDPQNRIWYHGIPIYADYGSGYNAVEYYQGSTLWVMQFGARVRETERIPEFLDKIGAEYKPLGGWGGMLLSREHIIDLWK